MKRLVINACARKDSNTYKIFEELVKQKNWGDFELVNLYNEYIPYVDEIMLNERENTYNSKEGLIEEKLVKQFESCDQVIFIYPTWNWNVPGILKSYLDMIMITHRTFNMKGNRTVGLTKIKQAVIINSTGIKVFPKIISYLFNINTDIYYMKNMMKIMGINDVVTLRVGNIEKTGYKLERNLIKKSKKIK